MWLLKSWTVFEFEFRRSLTWRRLLLALALAMFPVSMICLVQLQGAHLERDGRGELFVFFLVPVVLCLTGLLLWATGIIHVELEEKTWTYLSLRPIGRGAIIFGKYLAAVVWTVVCATASLAICLAVLAASGDSVTYAPRMALLAVIATLAYGAIFVMLAVVFPSRAMVAAIAYTAVMEAVVAWLPSAINQASVLYHLRCIFAQWLLLSPGTHGPGFDDYFFGTMPAWQHLAVLATITASLLAAATFVLRRRQLILSADD
jgi:ABC-type transport system involved in multi-copper enzyme maturation permease subunit